MGSPSPGFIKLKKDNSTTKAGPHRRSPSVTTCISMESVDKDVQSPAKSNEPERSHVASTSSARSPARFPGEKATSPAKTIKRRSSNGGSDDLGKGLDFSTTGSLPVEEKKHPFLARGGGHKSVARPASPGVQANSPGKKTSATPPGKERILGRATSTSMLSPVRKSDGSVKDIISPRRPGLVSEGLINNGIMDSNSELGKNAGSGFLAVEATTQNLSPRVSLEYGKVRKSSPRPTKKSRSDLATTKGRTNSNGDQLEAKSDNSSPREVSLDGKLRKPSPRSSLKLKSDLASSKGKKSTINRQVTPCPQQPGRVRRQSDIAARNEELLRPELESVEVPVYSENECEKEVTSEGVVSMLYKTPVPLQNEEVGGDGSTLLSSNMMDSGDVGGEELSSLEQGNKRGFDNENELPTSWLTEDLPSMFSSVSHLPEPDNSSSSLLGDPPEPLNEFLLMEEVGIKGSSDESLAIPIANDSVPVDKIEADQYRAHEDANTHGREFQQTLVPLFVEEYVVPDVAELQSLPILDKDETMPCQIYISTHPEGASSCTSANESSVSENVAHEAFLQKIQPILYQICEDPTEVSQVLAQSLEGDEEICFLELPSCSKDLGVDDARPTLQEGGSPAEDTIILAAQSSLEMYIVESRDDETLQGILEDSISESSADETLEESIEDLNSVQLNLKQSFDDVAEPLMDFQSKVDEICEENLPGVTKLTESESPAESLDVQVYRMFTPTHLNQDMITFEEFYWTQNFADESSQSNAGQNDAEDLHPNSLSSESHLLNEVQQETEKSLPPILLPVSILPIVGKLKLTLEEPIDSEPLGQSSPQLGASKLEFKESQGWRGLESTASLPASEDYQLGNLENANEEEPERYGEVFHLFKESEEMSTVAVLSDNLSSPSSPIPLPGEYLNQEPPNPILSGSFEELIRFDYIAGESDSNYVSPRNTTSIQETGHSYVVDIGEEKEVEVKLEGEANPDVVASNLEGSVDQEPNSEDLYPSPRLAVNSNGLLSVNIQHLGDSAAFDNGAISELPTESVDLSPTREDATYKSSSETPAQPDAYYMTVQSDDVLDLDLETLSMQNGLEIGAISVRNEETVDRADAEILVDPSESNTVASLLPPGDKISKEEPTEAKVWSSLGLVESPCRAFHNELGHVDSLGEMQILFDQEVSESGILDTLERAALVEDYSEFIPDGKVMFNSTETDESFQNTNSVTGEDKIEVAAHGSVDGSITIPAGRQIIVESYEDVNVSDIDMPQMPSLSTPGSDIMKDCGSEDGILDFVTRDAVDNSKPEVNSSALLGQEVVVEIREEDEASHIASEPVVLSVRELPDGSLNEVGELNRHIEVECKVEEEKPSNEAYSEWGVMSFEEQSARAVRGCEELPSADDRSGSKSSPVDIMDSVTEESIFTNASSSVAADESDTKEDLREISPGKPEEASSINISTASFTPGEKIEHHDQDLQVRPVNPGASTPKEVVAEVSSDYDAVKDVEIVSENCSAQDLPSKLSVVTDQDTKSGGILDVDHMKEHYDFSWKADKEDERLNRALVEEPVLDVEEDAVVYNPKNSFIVFGQDNSDTTTLGIQNHLNISRKVDTEGERLNESLQKDSMHEGEEKVVCSPNDSLDLYAQATPDTTTLGHVNDIQNHSNLSWTIDKDEESLNGRLKEELFLEDEDTVVYKPMESVIASSQDAPDTAILIVDKIEKHSNFPEKDEKEGESSLNGSLMEDSMVKVEDIVEDSPVESLLASGQDTTNAAILDVDMEEPPTGEGLNGSLKEEDSVLEVEVIVLDSSSDNVENVSASFPEGNDEMYSSSGSLVEELVCHSKADDGALGPLETEVENRTVDAVPISTDAGGAQDSLVVQTDDFDEKTAVVELKSSTPEITNGKQLHDSDCLNGATALIEKAPLVDQTGSNLVISTLRGAPTTSQDTPLEDAEPHCPAAPLYIPHLPPFSGSLQDRLWEEQAEAYSSGGQGTPTRNEDTSTQATFRSPSPKLEPASSSDDQIQPASGPMLSNGYAVVGASHGGKNGDEQKGDGEGKRHTPLRSLLLEDAAKFSADGDSNGATHSPSFIRRLFRVKSTPASRSAHVEKDVSPAKLKKSSSMWASCLGMPQVQQ